MRKIKALYIIIGLILFGIGCGSFFWLGKQTCRAPVERDHIDDQAYRDAYLEAELQRQILSVGIEACLNDQTCRPAIDNTWDRYDINNNTRQNPPLHTTVHGPFCFGVFDRLYDPVRKEAHFDLYIDRDDQLIKDFFASRQPGYEGKPINLDLPQPLY